MKWAFFLLLLLALVVLLVLAVQLKDGKLSALPKGSDLDPTKLPGTIFNFLGLPGNALTDNNPGAFNHGDPSGHIYNELGQQIG